FWFTTNVWETITIYDVDKTTVRGTLELKSLGGSGPDAAEDSFTGFGTGEFEGVKIKGTTLPSSVVLGNPNPPFYYLQLDRVGTIMG
ncbi:hypothetical protein JJE00_07310, partial [Candidatus Bathyarchaeota archaeon]|nr:hypothetical protein [Candidatus Bathyarchaeota archaeon]